VAALLAGAGKRVALFAPERRPELIVGESLVPAVVPILRRLGVEDEVRAISVEKPGATVTFGAAERHPLPFADAAGTLPDYSYNTPRDGFDRVLLGAAEAAGALRVDALARVRRALPDRLALTDASADELGDFFAGREPDLLIDATGRARLFARALGLVAVRGRRKDVALFAHYDGVLLERPGDIHVDRNARGWGWRIPLPGRVSVGVVVDRKHLGDGAKKDQLDAFVAADGALRERVHGRRVSEVMRYDNYQLCSTRLFGPSWALVGDAAGFADPIFSTGTYLAMRGAEQLADALTGRARGGLFAYQTSWLAELRAWQDLIDLWYDGRLFSLLRLGRRMRRLGPARPVDRHIGRHMTRIFTGEAGRGGYGQALLSIVAPVGRLGARALAIR
jgi:hypothetical protein